MHGFAPDVVATSPGCGLRYLRNFELFFSSGGLALIGVCFSKNAFPTAILSLLKK